MAQHKSAEKRARASEVKRARNKAALSKIKTLSKKVFSNEDKTTIDKQYKEAVSALDKMVSKGKMHKNTAARKKSALSKYVNKVLASAK
ncbi:MAG TPA: 30S ribosomal protein S20 [Melioribacteraceae bacterium]|nr:30S ribosomal protein S20 [Melioribacteraceae bacterium]